MSGRAIGKAGEHSAFNNCSPQGVDIDDNGGDIPDCADSVIDNCFPPGLGFLDTVDVGRRHWPNVDLTPGAVIDSWSTLSTRELEVPLAMADKAVENVFLCAVEQDRL